MICDQGYTAKNTYNHHINSQKHKKMAHRRGLSLSLESFDPTTYCDYCKTPFKNIQRYKQHLWNMHHPLQPNPAITPDPLNKDYYCDSCKFTFKNKRNYHDHLKNIHKGDVVVPLNRGYKPRRKPDSH